MIWSDVALSTGARLSGNRHGTGMTCVAGRAVTDRAVVVGFADAVALFAPTGHCRWPFKSHERMWRTLDASRLISLGKVHLLRSECFLSSHRSPRHSGMPAVQELLIDVFVAAAAVARGEGANDGKSVVRLPFLSIRRLVAIQTIDPFLRVFANFVFVNNRILRARVAISALS